MNSENKKYKIAILSPVPFYYHIPLYRKLNDSDKIDFMVYYCSDETIKGTDIKKVYHVNDKKITKASDLLGNYKHEFLRNYSLFPSLIRWPFGLMNFSIWKKIKKGGYDAVVLQAWTNMTWWIAFWACIFYKVPIFFMTDANVLYETRKHFFKKIIKHYILRFVFNKSDGFLSAGKANREFYLYHGADPDKITKFHFLWGYEYFLEKAEELFPEREAIRQSLGINNNDFVILFVGRFSREKRIFDLLFAYQKIKSKNKKMILVGDGPLREKIEKYIKDLDINGVTIIGFQTRSNISRFYVASDVLVLPSENETWGMVVNESLCFGLPVIASDMVGAAVDMIQDGENGFTFPAGDVNSLVERLDKIMSLSTEIINKFHAKSKEIIKKWVEDVDPEKQIIKLLTKKQEDNIVINKNILVVSPYIPWPLYGGTLVRIYNLIKEIKQRGYHVTLLAGAEGDEYFSLLKSNNPLINICKDVYLFKLAQKIPLISKIVSIFSIKPYPVSRFKACSHEIERLLERDKYGLIWVHLSVLADICSSRKINNVPIMLDHPEVEEFVYRDYIKEGNFIAKIFSLINIVKFHFFHKRVFSSVQSIVCVSNEEAEFTKRQCKKGTKIFVAPNGVDASYFFPNTDKKLKVENNIILCSSMSVKRNIDAALWFAKEIFPIVRSEIPNAKFFIVGSNPVQEILKLNESPGIHVTGTVPNINEYYKKGRIFVAPYRFGAGTKLKVLEAMASGIPVVSTSIGCRGIAGIINGEHALIADNKEEFANCVVKILKEDNLAMNISKNAFLLMKDKYYWSKIAEELELKIREIIRQNNHGFKT
jgi:glycosyltransferase involved in cell wall biosynthesis